jgi:hypothetical protein
VHRSLLKEFVIAVSVESQNFSESTSTGMIAQTCWWHWFFSQVHQPGNPRHKQL